jgi:hypothetical protein
MQYNKRKLAEGLRSHDLKDYVSDLFTVDRYSSKMGNDQDIVVLGFHVNGKYPAADVMEFMERGYPFILDSDMSAGEEQDGKYQVFVEIERTIALPGRIKELLSGVGQLCDCYDWQFKYQYDKAGVKFSEESIIKHVPLTSADYENKIVEIKNGDIAEFFDKGAIDSITLEADNTLTFSKPYAEDLSMKFIAIGPYVDVKNTVPGPLSLDESSQSQIFYMQKYLGDYSINKIGNKFLITNRDQAVVVEKTRW